MKNKIYNTQEEFIGEWLDYFRHAYRRGPPSLSRSSRRRKNSEEEIEENKKTLTDKVQKTMEKGNLEEMPFLKFIHDNKLSETEIIIIIHMYGEYLEWGAHRAKSLASILSDVTENSKAALRERKKILKNGTLFETEILIQRDGHPLIGYGKKYTLSGKAIAMLEGFKEKELEEENEENTPDVFELVKPRKSLDDVILTGETDKNIQVILRQIEKKEMFFEDWGLGEKFEKGKGLIIMFYGPPGTGKTLAAEAIACELDYSLYIVSLSDVLNPYYGVTEKNIKKVFEEAKGKDCILLLDEVDAFISKRSKGGSYWDSHHNRKISLFLRLIENFEGVAVLTTNIPDVLDSALERRVSIKLEFPRPDLEMREKLWKLLIPDKLPLSKNVNIRKLAEKYEMTGGEIKNTIMNAARMSLLKKNPEVTQKDLEEAAGRERICDEAKAGFV